MRNVHCYKNKDDAATIGTGLLIGVAYILGVCVMHWVKQTVTIRNELALLKCVSISFSLFLMIL